MLEVVELGIRCVDELVVRGAPPVERRPAQLQLCVQRFGVGRRIGHLAPIRGRPHRASLEAIGQGYACVVEQRGQHVNRPRHRAGDAAGGNARARHDPRHPQRGVVDEHAVRRLSVLSEALAVIRGHEHDRVIECAGVLNRLQQASQLTVHERNLAVVGRCGEARREIGRRLVRRMGVVVVHPQKPRRRSVARAHRGEPSQRHVRRRVRAAFHVGRPPRIVAAGQVVVVPLESPVEPETPIEREPRDEGARPIPRLVKVLGGGLQRWSEHEPAVVVKAMGRGGVAREDRRMRRARQRDVGHGGLEPDAAPREAVERGGRGAGVAVRAERDRHAGCRL